MLPVGCKIPSEMSQVNPDHPAIDRLFVSLVKGIRPDPADERGDSAP